ncbi:GDSL-like lipase/acylhydrolase family protein [Saccharopolyspora erythraea NRRL 2338]|uniref:Secreted hydrolase n=2 Tax=Saccharopolyspora erythraea TaxID=1836 RepID=A4FK69_SACEN|nr:SGNH/GDSL hydrolase family protein [Saccharopolyspora erythraea]PFG98082.1 GDSL-like lipase/acylhydrolase family protein [Saccharopolyspora erythraea NRRL 2338]QRK88193.1 SGNH/GDSL hydrolase family protein [Saccharopolyspora erythraea]CAM04444.1 secreted hydrolase [Saccharopolyspora erythraea NRRL 2338]
MHYLRQAACVTAATAMTLATTVIAAPAFAADAATNYVALGDSYSSGVGSREYFEDSGDCLRSPKSYAQLWADAHGVDSFTFNACSGATTDDVNSGQLDGLGADTTLVTISVGGNDVGFSSVVQDCLLGNDEGCDNAVSAAEEKGRSELPGKLDTTYANIKQAAPNAEVVVLGYPRLNQPTGGCGIPGFSEAKRQRINAGADVLAEVISERASAAGFTYADTRDAFEGHGVCSSSEWINGPSNPLQESFHPNTSGYAEGYLPVLNSVTG